MSLPVDPINVFEKLSDLIKERRFKKGRIRISIDRSATELERRRTVIEGIWDTWVNNPPGIFLKGAEICDLVEEAERGYTVTGLTPKYTGKEMRRNVREEGDMFVSAQSILYIELLDSSE